MPAEYDRNSFFKTKIRLLVYIAKHFPSLRFPAILVFFLLSAFATVAQPKKLPPFQMVQADGKVFKAEELPKGKPILLIYFSPDCEHCQKLMDTFFKQPAKFKKATVAMLTYLPVDKVATFVKDYPVAKYPNIYVGTEGNTLFVQRYYNLSQIPFVALYKKNGDFVTSYVREVPLKKLAAQLAQLK